MCLSSTGCSSAPLFELPSTLGREHTKGDMISAIEINNGHAGWSSMRIVPII